MASMNHGIDVVLMEKEKRLLNLHYEEQMKKSFYESEVAARLKSEGVLVNTDWESTFFNFGIDQPLTSMSSPTFARGTSDKSLCKSFCTYID
ncbi:hypothetical protein Sjap_012298 [Stephania japonica]|uniref:Uncharacterized protein n=1 Tax=Stephania japonica TaxID=461633 RepID=A0AAP0P074_9MAGN